MDNAISDRLYMVVLKFAKSTLAFAIDCGLHHAALIKQLRGARSVSLETIIAVCSRYPEISMEWLVLGIGEMFKEENSSEKDELIKSLSDMTSLAANQALKIQNLEEKISKLESK